MKTGKINPGTVLSCSRIGGNLALTVRFPLLDHKDLPPLVLYLGSTFYLYKGAKNYVPQEEVYLKIGYTPAHIGVELLTSCMPGIRAMGEFITNPTLILDKIAKASISSVYIESKEHPSLIGIVGELSDYFVTIDDVLNSWELTMRGKL